MAGYVAWEMVPEIYLKPGWEAGNLKAMSWSLDLILEVMGSY